MNGNDRTHRSGARYSAVAQALHWATALLVLVAFIYGPGGSEQRVYSPARDFDRQIHETLGLCVLAVAVVRLLWRAIETPPRSPQGPRWMGIAAKAVHGALYVILFALPLSAVTAA